MNKDKFREQLAGDIDQFLREGGRIEPVDSRRVCPPHMQWIADRGMDYSVWDEVEGDDYCRRSGDFKLDPEDFEEE